MTVVVALVIALAAGTVRAQEKPVPADSARIFINGCARGRVFTVGPPRADLPGRSDVPEGRRFRMNGPRAVMDEIKKHEATEIEITGLVRKGQERPGVTVGGVRIGPGPAQGGGGLSRSPVIDQTTIDVEGWRLLVAGCPAR